MPELYIPQGAVTLDKSEPAQIRLGIQGFPKTGKTWSALTFPNPVIYNSDRALGAHIGRADVVEIRAYGSYIKTNAKDECLDFLSREGPKFKPHQTVIVDGLTTLELSYHAAWRRNPVISRATGAVDDRKEWGLKEVYFDELCNAINALPCHAILICHEQPMSDKDGSDNGKIRPLMTGKTRDKLVSRFSDWVRQLTTEKPKDVPSPEKLALWGMKNGDEWKAMCAKFPGNTIYYWVLEGDNSFDGGTSSLVNPPKFIPANYESFVRYMRKPISA